MQQRCMDRCPGSVRILCCIVGTVADIFLYICRTVAGSQRRIHQGPVPAVELDDTVHPADFIHIAADPCVVDIPGIADIQFGGDTLGTQHGRHQRGIVKADAFPGGQSIIRYRDISVGNRVRFLLVVSNMFDHKIINIGNDIQIRGTSLRQCFAFCHAGRILCEVHIEIRIQERGKIITDGHIQILGKRNRVEVVLHRHRFQQRDLVRTAPAGQRIDGIRISICHRIGVFRAIRQCHLQLNLFITAGVAQHDIAVRGVRSIHRYDVTAVSHDPVRLWNQHLCRGIPCAVRLCGPYGRIRTGIRIMAVRRRTAGQCDADTQHTQKQQKQSVPKKAVWPIRYRVVKVHEIRCPLSVG